MSDHPLIVYFSTSKLSALSIVLVVLFWILFTAMVVHRACLWNMQVVGPIVHRVFNVLQVFINTYQHELQRLTYDVFCSRHFVACSWCTTTSPDHIVGALFECFIPKSSEPDWCIIMLSGATLLASTTWNIYSFIVQYFRINTQYYQLFVDLMLLKELNQLEIQPG